MIYKCIPNGIHNDCGKQTALINKMVALYHLVSSNMSPFVNTNIVNDVNDVDHSYYIYRQVPILSDRISPLAFIAANAIVLPLYLLSPNI